MKVTRIIITLLIVTLLLAGLGISRVLLAALSEAPATTPSPHRAVAQSVVLERTEASAETPKGAKISPAYLPNDLHFNRVLKQIPVASGTTEILIAILDTGIDPEHKDLAGKVAASINFSQSKTVSDINGHGTHVAGIIVATVNNGVAGDTPNIRLLNVKVADDTGLVWASTVAQGIIWAVDNGAKVINLSLFLPTPSPALEQAIDYAWSKGAVLIAGAGNGIKSIPVYPAAYPKVIAVAAIDSGGKLWSGSNYGDWVGVYAPGVEIYSTLPGNSYGYLSGTSMATAYVTAVTALALTTVTDANGDGRVNDEVAALLKTLLPLPR